MSGWNPTQRLVEAAAGQVAGRNECLAELALLREAVRRASLSSDCRGGVLMEHTPECAYVREYYTDGECDCNRPKLQAAIFRAMGATP